MTYVEIGVQTGYHLATISKWCRGGGPPAARTIGDEERVVDPRWADRLTALLVGNSSLLATSLFEIIRAEGFDGSYPSVARWVREQRGPRFRRADSASVPIETSPGTYTAPSVLVIDDIGLLPMDRAAASAFYQVVNLRYEKQHSTIVTTNRGLPDWGEIFGDTVVAAAILDRLMHNAVVFNIKGPSWRLREHQALTTATTDPTKKRIH
ncbi:MAG: ATP-binding protein [Acidimicrobiales bacterium]